MLEHFLRTRPRTKRRAAPHPKCRKGRPHIILSWGIRILFAWIFLSPAASLQAQDIPPSEEPSVIEKKVRLEAEESLRPKREIPEVEEEKRPEKPVGEPELLFFVKAVRLEGNSVISSAELEPLIRSYENKEQTLGALDRLAKVITAEYKRRGFITSTAYIPPQKLEGGIFRIRIVEGKMGRFQVEGNRFFRKKRLLAYSRMEQGEILRYQRLRRFLRKVNENPDRQVRSILRRGEKEETTDILLKVKDRFPLHLGFLLDNQGSESSGQERIGLTLRDSNLTGLDDMLSTGSIFGSHFGAAFAQYGLAFPSTNTRLLEGFSYAQVSPKKDLTTSGVNGISHTFSTRIEQGIVDRDRLSLNFNGSLDFKESRTKVLSGTFRRERLRAIRFGPSLRMEDSSGITQLNHEFSFGVKAFGALIHADPGSRQGVEPDFFKVSGGANRIQKMPRGTKASFRIDFLLTRGQLPSSEGFSLGGAGSVRGYPEGDYIGDSGLLFSFEYLMPAFFIPPEWILPRSKTPLRNQVEIVMFADEGYGRLRGPTGRERHDRNLIGTGGGFRVRLFQNLYARAEWAYATGQEPLTEPDHVRFHFRIQAEI